MKNKCLNHDLIVVFPSVKEPQGGQISSWIEGLLFKKI